MDDPILSPEPAPAVLVPQAPPPDPRLDRLEQAMSQLTETVRDAANRLTATPVQGPPQRPDEFLNDLAADPQGVIQRVAADTFRKAAAESLNPAVLQVLDTSNAQQMAGHEARIDQDFGEGTYREVFKPQLDKDFSQLRQVNPRAIADPATLDALVNRLYGGENFQVLTDRRKALEKTAQTRGLSHLLPAGGVPRLRVGNPELEIPPDSELFLREVERSTGETIDRKHFAKIFHTGVETGPGRHRTSVIDYLKAVGADPDTVKRYGG